MIYTCKVCSKTFSAKKNANRVYCSRSCYVSTIRGKQRGAMTLRHGNCTRKWKSRAYGSWLAMWARCTNPKLKEYPNYGGRGITVCDRWKDFAKFLDDMGSRPVGTSLDRYPDNNGNYEPRNCRWATCKEQRNNTRVNHPLTLNGQTKNLREWSVLMGIPEPTLHNRLRHGWTTELALTTPVDAKFRNKTRTR